MSIADIALLVVLGLSMLIGLVRGFVVEVMAIVVWICAIALAHWFGPILAVQFSDAVELSSARIFLGYGLIFIASLIGGAILIYFLKKLVAGTGLTGTDRLFGMVFGAVRGLALLVVLILVMGLTPMPKDPWWQSSQMISLFRPMAERARAWLPEPVAKHIQFDATTAPAPAPLKSAADVPELIQ